MVFARRPVPAPWRVIAWDGVSPGAWIQELDDTDVLINLTGRNVNCRYNAKNRQEIMESRVHSTRLLGQALNKVAHPPRLWMDASTATIYRHALDRPMDEYTGEIGGNESNANAAWRFSIQVATEWEKGFLRDPHPKNSQNCLTQRRDHESRRWRHSSTYYFVSSDSASEAHPAPASSTYRGSMNKTLSVPSTI